MKKSLLSVALAAVASVGFAQQKVADASNWKVGEDISDKIEWGNLKFESNPMDYWTLTKGSGSTTETGGLFEVYDGSDCDLFQYVYLPKGQYRLQCQGYYRCGGSDQNESGDPTAFDNGDFEYNAQLYVQDGTYSQDTKEFKRGYLRFENPLMPRLYEMRSEQLFFASNGQADWMTDGVYTVNGQTACGPCSVDGSLVWFGKGYYSPTWVSKEEAYNLVDFFMVKDGYVRLGVSKVPARGQDSFMVTNFQMIYNGDVDSNAEIYAKQSAVGAAYEKLSEMQSRVEDEYSGVFYDVVYEFIDTIYVDASKMTVEECNATIEKFNGYYDRLIEAENTYKSLARTYKLAKILNDKTNYPGKDAFEAVLTKTSRLIEADQEKTDDDTPETFAVALDELLTARMTYVMSQDSPDGSYDFSFAITYPFFCLPEYEPTWDEDNQTWVPNEAVMESNWAKFDDCDGTDKTTHTVTENNEQVTYDVPAIAEGVTISGDTNVKNAWFSENTEGGRLSIYWNDKLTCAKKWDVPHEGYNRTCQVVTGIPNGYYKLKALAQTWSNDWNDNCHNHIFIQSGENKSMSEYLTPGGWWGNDINQWKELETQMIQVTNNEVLIAGEDNGFAAFTGFRLYYYGETPNFRDLIKNDIIDVEICIEELPLNGDKAAAQALYDKIPNPIKTPEEFQIAMAALAEAQAYIKEAQRVNAEFDNIVNTLNNSYGVPAYEGLAAKAAEVSQPGVDGLDYKGELEVKAAYDALNTYLNLINVLDDYTNESSIAAVIADNETILKANYCNAARVRELQSALELAYHKVYFAANVKDASEAKPADVTGLIINADFSNGSNGWDAAGISVDGNFKDAEFYDKTFNLNQTIYGLPAGCYVVQVQGFYRNGTNYANIYNEFVNEAFSDVELWDNHNVVLYANERATYMTSFASEYYTERGMVKRFDSWDGGDMVTKDMSEFEENALNSHPWDASFDLTTYDDLGVETGTVKLYYPNSMEGAMWRFQTSPEAYINKVAVMVGEGESLSFGLRKSVKVSGDWCIFDNFKLFYLGTETPAGVNAVSTSTEAKDVFSVSGIKTNGMKKGINIVKMADGSVVKIVK